MYFFFKKKKQDRQRIFHGSKRSLELFTIESTNMIFRRIMSSLSKLFLVQSLLLMTTMDIRADWIDPETPENARITQSLVLDESNRSRQYTAGSATSLPLTFVDKGRGGKLFQLVMSDEFNTPGRQFDDGKDPKWTALDKNDYTNDALHYYSSNNVRTNEEGELEIVAEIGDTDVIGFDDVKRTNTLITKHFRSGMLQGWNKFCFTGGIIEAEVTLPGYSSIGGLWPSFWLLGNLARHTYVGSSSHIWPFSAHICNSYTRHSQTISGCNRRSHYDLLSQFGRGAPEIDIFEIQPGPMKKNMGQYLRSFVGQPFMSASYQFAPGRPDRPGVGWWPGPGQWYEGAAFGNNTCLNIVYYGTYNSFLSDVTPAQAYWSDAVSYNHQLGEEHFSAPHVYRLEWGLPNDSGENVTDGLDSGYLSWFVDDELILSFNGTTLRAAGLGAEISSEPMYIILNTAISRQWGFPKTPNWCPGIEYNCHSDNINHKCAFDPLFCQMMETKPTMKINYVRVYQDVTDEKQKVGCSTPERPTWKYIKANENLYKKEHDLLPLKPIQQGRGQCNHSVEPSIWRSESCGGGERGICTLDQVCECKPGWTGPNCLVPDGRNPIEYDLPESISDLEIKPPIIVPRSLLIGLIIMLAMLLNAVLTQRRGWSPVPDVKKAYARDV